MVDQTRAVGASWRRMVLAVATTGIALAVLLPWTPANAAAPADRIATVTCSVVSARTVSCTASNFDADTEVTISLDSSGECSSGASAARSTELGRHATDANGSYTVEASIPDGYTGLQTITARTSDESAQTQLDLGGCGIDAESDTRDGSSKPVTTSSTAATASTGYAVFGTAGLGALLLLVGGVLVLSARRRHRRS